MNEKDQSMLDERIKRSAKQPPPSSVRASTSGQINNQANAQQQSYPVLPNSNSLTSISNISNGVNSSVSTAPSATNGNHVSNEEKNQQTNGLNSARSNARNT